MIRDIWRRKDGKPFPQDFNYVEWNDLNAIEECDCGEIRLIFAGDHTDAWRKHFDFCTAGIEVENEESDE